MSDNTPADRISRSKAQPRQTARQNPERRLYKLRRAWTNTVAYKDGLLKEQDRSTQSHGWVMAEVQGAYHRMRQLEHEIRALTEARSDAGT